MTVFPTASICTTTGTRCRIHSKWTLISIITTISSINKTDIIATITDLTNLEVNTIVTLFCAIMIKAQNEGPYIHIDCSRTNSTIHFNLFCITNIPISRGHTSIRHLLNLRPSVFIKCLTRSRNKLCIHSKSLICWSIIVSTSRPRNSNCCCTRLLIDVFNSNHIVIYSNLCNTGITGCSRNLTIASTCHSYSISQLTCVQCHRSLIQTQATSRLTDCPRHFLGSSRTITPAIIRFGSKRSLICASSSLFGDTTNSQLCCIVVAKCRRKFCPCIS